MSYARQDKYLGMTLNTKLRWKAYAKKKKSISWAEVQTIVLIDRKTFLPVNVQQCPVVQTSQRQYYSTISNYGVVTTRVTSWPFSDFKIRCWGTLSTPLALSEVWIWRWISSPTKSGDKYEERLHRHDDVVAIQLLDKLTWCGDSSEVKNIRSRISVR